MTEPLPVDGLIDFRDIAHDDRAARIAQYALSLKILAAVERLDLSEQQRAQIKASLTSAKEKSDKAQKKLTDAIAK